MRDEIIAASEKLFAQFAIKSITMDEIAHALGMSKKTLYIHCTDKNDLLQEVYLSPLKKAEDRCVHIHEECNDAIEEVFACWRILEPVIVPLNEKILHDLQKYHTEVFYKYEQFRKVFLSKLLQRNIERGKKELLYRTNIESELIARHEVATLVAKQSLFVSGNQKWQPHFIDEQLLLHYLNGLATRTGVKLIEKYQTKFSKQFPESPTASARRP